MHYAAVRRTEANQAAFERMTKSDPVLIDLRPVRGTSVAHGHLGHRKRAMTRSRLWFVRNALGATDCPA